MGIPRNSFFGDGTPFEEDTMNTIRRIYEEEMVSIPWESGDIAIVDNMLVHHGRNPFQGERWVLISMGGDTRWLVKKTMMFYQNWEGAS